MWRRKNLNLTPESVLLDEAIYKRLATVEASGTQFGMFSLAVTVTSRVKRPLFVKFPSGLLFEADDRALTGLEPERIPESLRTQDLMTTETAELEVPPLEKKVKLIQSVCFDMRRKPPTINVPFVFASTRQASPHIKQLINSPLYLGFDVRIRQYAIWILRHNPAWYQLVAVGVLGAPLTKPERVKIEELLKAVGIPTTEYAVFDSGA